MKEMTDRIGLTLEEEKPKKHRGQQEGRLRRALSGKQRLPCIPSAAEKNTSFFTLSCLAWNLPFAKKKGQ